MEQSLSDVKMARLARVLAEALAKYAYERNDDAKKEVMRLQMELVQARRDEMEPKV